MLTEPVGFVINTGILDMGGKSHVSNVILHFMFEKLQNGHCLYMDNYFISFDLVTKLIQQIHIVPER